jgi:propionate catabolism operon transcriptional regulator
MRPQVCVISIGLTSKMIAAEVDQLNLPADFIFEEMLLHSDSPFPERLNRYDVFFSSGNNAKVLKRKSDKPIITIEPSLYDILTACSKAMEYSSAPVIIIHKDAFSAKDVRQLSNILAVKIKLEFYDETDERVEGIVIRYKEMGYKCIIGSGMVCELAEKLGMQSIFLFPKESIRRSLETAASLAVSIRRQNSQNLQLSTIVNNSKQGILFVDQKNTIFLCNPRALQYLDASQDDVIGKKLDHFFTTEDIQRMYVSGEINHIFCKIKGRALVVTAIPMILKQEVTDLLLYIEDVGEIQKTERAIRRENWIQKGFTAKYTFEKYHPHNRDFQHFLSLAKSFARTDEPIVILGETGSGKEVLAQSIHNFSSRSDKAFVAVNCAAISETLLESELFGYNEGAFTGALKGGKEGYFEMAHMGTIFLDEIGEMSPALQSKLLRVIQEKQVLRVGGSKLIPFDARLIVATNRNLWDLVQNNTFRMDLYYRLNVLELEIPPLRARKDDIIPLLREFVQRRSPSTWNIISLISGELEKYLCEYSWPGNIRELENFAHTLIASIKPDDPPLRLITFIVDSLKKKYLRIKPEGAKSKTSGAETLQLASDSSGIAPNDAILPSLSGNGDSITALTTDIRSLTGKQIRETLSACNGSIPQAARLLGIHRTTLWRKIKAAEKS